MTADVNIQVLLKTRPEAEPAASDFDVVERPIPEPGDGEFLCKTKYLSLDPYMRSQIAGRHLSGAINPGDLMRGEAVSEVIKSKNPDFKEGDLIAMHSGWQSHFVTDGKECKRVDNRIEPASLAIGVMGMPGLTAFAGFMHLAEPKAGDVVVVSAASGAVGSMVGQMARIKGCKVVGIAGSDEKCAWTVDVAGFDSCINYKTDDLASALKEHCPDGVDVYFDNVGGDMLNTIMEQLAVGARVVLCGLIAQYNTGIAPNGPNPATIIRSRATVRGLVVYDHEDKRADFIEQGVKWLADGDIRVKEDVTEGLENAPHAFARLMSGQNFGKTIIKV